MGIFSFLSDFADVSKGEWLNSFKGGEGEKISEISLSIGKSNVKFFGFFPESCEATLPNSPNIIFYGLDGISIVYLYAVLNLEQKILTPICLREENSSGEFIDEKYYKSHSLQRFSFNSIGLINQDEKKIHMSTKYVDTDFSRLPKTWYDKCNYSWEPD